MKTNKMLWMGLLSTMMLGSCADNDENSQWTDPNQVQFTASIQGLVTKATDDAWEEGDQIGIFMKDAAAEWSAAGTQNVAYTTDAAGALSPAGTVIYYPSEDATVDFMAYYPYTAGLGGTTYNVNVATQTSQSAIDLLYADNAKGVQKADGNVVLNFSHKLAKVVFNIVPDGVTITESDLGSLTVALQNVNTTAAFDLATGTLGSAAGQANVNMLVDATAKTAEAIILPGDGPIEVAFTFNGETKTGTMDTPSFAAGSKYTYNVSLSMGDAENAVHFGNATITDWTDVPGNEIDINFDGEGGGDEPIEAVKVTDDQPFTGLDDNGQGNFTIKDVTLPSDLSYVWKWDEGSNESRSWRYMKASAYLNETNYESESWLISPALDLTEVTSPVLTFSHAVNYAKGTAQTALTLWVTEAATENWQQITITNYPTSDSWTVVPSGDIDLSAYAGKTIKIGFKYTSTASAASTWEVMDVKVASSNGGGTDPEPTPGENLLTNPGFEDWTATLPTAWDNASYNTGEIVKETTIKHGGNNSLRQTSESGTNKVQQEVAIEGGKTYQISYWFLDNDTKASSRYWFAIVDASNKTITDLNDQIQQQDYSSDSADWQHVEIEFTAPANAAKLRYEVRTYRNMDSNEAGGYIYYDDMSLVEVTK